MRPHQWIKNLIIFAALIFSKSLTNSEQLITTIYGFLIFSLIAGGTYIINDILDKENDLEHPEKSKRPIASGKLSINTALTFSTFIITLSIFLSFLLDFKFGITILIYLILSFSYSKYLKKIVLLDIIVLASFYVIRAIAGALLINVFISPWLILCTFLLAIFLALGKRRNELISLSANAQNHRLILKDYNLNLLDQLIAVVTSSTVIVYILYVLSEDVKDQFGDSNLIYTTPFVLYGIFRYLYLIHKKDSGGNPSKLLFIDKPLLLNTIAWIVLVIILIYTS